VYLQFLGQENDRSGGRLERAILSSLYHHVILVATRAVD